MVPVNRTDLLASDLAVLSIKHVGATQVCYAALSARLAAPGWDGALELRARLRVWVVLVLRVRIGRFAASQCYWLVAGGRGWLFDRRGCHSVDTPEWLLMRLLRFYC
ncbi:Pseudouridine synthase [Candidatus Hodgkinia cicadicola]|nr:Pseudouridine synthase [Candidatus Hodgkinia cicadicola]